jgi:serine O-acetyltransferase
MIMRLSLSTHALTAYVARQLEVLLPDGASPSNSLEKALGGALERLEHCIGHSPVKYFRHGGEPVFDHLHTDQYAMFLYFLANEAYRTVGDLRLAAKCYSLNKTLHALDVYYEVELPDIFVLQHPVGTVLGRAKYADYLYVYQRCSVGTNLDGAGPVFGTGTVLFGGSVVIGECQIGANCWVSAGTQIMDEDVPPNSVVFGASPGLIVKPTARHVARDMFMVNGTEGGVGRADEPGVAV